MKKIDLGQAIGILANIGVIAGIVFLGVELRQNNESLAATVRAARAASSQGSFAPTFQNPALAEALVQANGYDSETMDEVKRSMVVAFYQYMLIGWQFSWGEYRAGVLKESDLPVRGWMIALTANPALE